MLMRLLVLSLAAMFLAAGSIPKAVASQERVLKERTDKVILIFLPGIFGSRLFNAETGKWHWGVDDYGSRGLSLDLYPTMETSLLERAQVRFLHRNWIDRNVYSDFKRHGRWLAGEVLSFAYDWRKSNRKSAAEFDRWLCKKLPPPDKRVRIVFVAHSMGGLVLRHWFKDFLEAKRGCNGATAEQIDQIVFAGTPHLGSLEPMNSLLTGESALTQEAFFSLIFTDNIVRDALTFESTYELLPAYNLVRPDCGVSDRFFSEKVVAFSDTGTPIDVQLWNDQHWELLGLPAKLPNGMDRDDLMDIVNNRLQAATETVCSLLSHQHSRDLRGKMLFLSGSKTSPDGMSKIQDTLSELVIQTGAESLEIKSIDALGDGTVPFWSSYPPWRLGDRDLTSVSANHDALLSDADAKLTIESVLKYSAQSAAIIAGEMFRTKLTDEAGMRDVLAEFAAFNPSRLDPEIYKLAIAQLHGAATTAGIDGNELYDLTNNYRGNNRSAFRAAGFAVAALDVTSLNKERQFWANQNAAFALYSSGAAGLATDAALEAGQANISYFGAGERAGSAVVASPEKFIEHDSKWRSVAARSLEAIGLEQVGRSVAQEPIRSFEEFEMRFQVYDR